MVRGNDGVVAAKYYRYGAYGKTLSEMVNIVNQPNKYTSKPFDDDLGLNLYYFGARYVYIIDNPMKYKDWIIMVFVRAGRGGIWHRNWP
jgi:hypothetical protein